jgi:hypothetical protein
LPSSARGFADLAQVGRLVAVHAQLHHLEAGRAMRVRFLDARRRLLVLAAGGIELQAAAPPAEQLAHRAAGELALDVPERRLDPEIADAADRRDAQHLLHVLDVVHALAEQQLGERVAAAGALAADGVERAEAFGAFVAAQAHQVERRGAPHHARHPRRRERRRQRKVDEVQLERIDDGHAGRGRRATASRRA